jgi:hypothetical protein
VRIPAKPDLLFEKQVLALYYFYQNMNVGNISPGVNATLNN